MSEQGDIRYLGAFVDPALEHKNTEGLLLSFAPSSIDLQQRWSNNGLSADFIAEYFKQFYSTQQPAENAVSMDNLRDAVKYIANELLENAMKFQIKTSGFSAQLFLSLANYKITFCVTNWTSPEHAHSLECFAQKLLQQEDVQALYIETMTKNAEEENAYSSGLGLLSMVCDYSAEIAWRFEENSKPDGEVKVQTLVILTP